jgi:uncharacterized protein (DUF2141 family)
MRKLILATFLVSFVALFANAKNTDPGNGTNKKTDINGAVFNNDTKKPLRDVNVTAYLTTKKEKVVITDGNGNYSFDDLKPGTYKFVFEKDGFQKVVKDKILIRTDEAFQMNIEMIIKDEYEFFPGTFHFGDLN